MTLDVVIPSPLRWAKLNVAQQERLLQRPAQTGDADIYETARSIVTQVRKEGDAALLDFGQRFDNVAVQYPIEVSATQLAAAADQLGTRTRDAITTAIETISAFHSAQKPTRTRVETKPGVVCEKLSHALDCVGLYVPAGSAPLPSTAMMLAIPAQLAGCPQRILCTPPGPDGRPNATVLAVASLCDVQRVFCVGGAQAIAAMAYGTESVPRVTKIFGPGNQWVTAAKTLVAQDPEGAACDMPAGPSELLIIADAAADAEFIAADLLSQAEHGADSQVLLLTDCPDQAMAVIDELRRQIPALSRNEIMAEALATSAIIVTKNLDEAVAISNDYAPEHLILNIAEPRRMLEKVRNAGSVFLGRFAPESVGDYCSGTNHVLPTYGWARSYSGLSVNDFRRSFTVQELSE
ncbi:MAG: histidinol dehydrogenase, partial [Gammaproteobacteria bacterium]|nr:histidinol dehydrogenase [Gammaproteobacteria bacterium]